MVRRLFQSFYPVNQPWITRQSYRWELLHALTMPAPAALIEGGVIGVLAKKAFNVSPLLFATIMAAPMFANVTSFAWAQLARGRRKVRFLVGIQVILLALIAAVGLLPTGGIGPELLTLLIIVTRCMQAGLVTIRSTLWRANYPRAVRAQVTSRLVMIASILMAFVPLIGYAVLDWREQSFRVIYPASTLAGFVGVWAFSHVRMRRERELLRYEQEPTHVPQPHGTPAPVYEYDPIAEKQPTFWTVLRQDVLFSRYMVFQFLSGCSMMASEVVLIYIVAEMTSGHPREYLISILITTAIPTILGVITLQYWARMFDRMHVIEFRVRTSAIWISYLAAIYVGVMFESLLIIMVGRVILGCARGSGTIAWMLGHNDFANRRLVALYMGIHVTLTGVRGALAPFVGMMLFIGWDGPSGFAFGGFGKHVFAATLALGCFAQGGFWLLQRSMPTRRETEED